jgi:hypothetical protein
MNPMFDRYYMNPKALVRDKESGASAKVHAKPKRKGGSIKPELDMMQKGGPKKKGKKKDPKDVKKPNKPNTNTTKNNTQKGTGRGRPKGSKNKKNEISNRQAAAKLGSSAGGFIKRMGKWVLPALGAKEISDITGLTNLIFPDKIDPNKVDYKTNTGDLPGTNNRSNPNTSKSNKYKYGGPQVVNKRGMKVPGMYYDGGSVKKKK